MNEVDKIINEIKDLIKSNQHHIYADKIESLGVIVGASVCVDLQDYEYYRVIPMTVFSTTDDPTGTEPCRAIYRAAKIKIGEDMWVNVFVNPYIAWNDRTIRLILLN